MTHFEDYPPAIACSDPDTGEQLYNGRPIGDDEMFLIKWHKKTDPSIRGNGVMPLTYDAVTQHCNDLNQRWPELHHEPWPIPLTD